jgi:Na+-transporting methylmalonyl-CoA/oxaloacetate decarboxylase gamma subunit
MITRLLLVLTPLVGLLGVDRPLIAVFLGLFLLLACIWLVIDIRRQLAQTRAAAQPPAPPPPPPPAPVIMIAPPEAVPGTLVAVIAAAVHCALGASARVVSITSASDAPGNAALAWSAEGRRAIYSSHKVR